MKQTDRDQFGRLWMAAWDLYGKAVTPDMLGIAFAALSEFSIEQITTALSAHVRDPDVGRFAPKPADLIGRLASGRPDGRPDANEAWAACPRDERITVVWSDEMAQAWGVAQPLIAEGDMMAARMAFRDRYEFLVAEARRCRTPVKWTASVGHDPSGREGPVVAAVHDGRLSFEQARLLLPHSEGLDRIGRGLIADRAGQQRIAALATTVLRKAAP